MLVTPADFILHTGDMVYETGAATDYDPKYFLPYADLLRRLVLWPCLGNHEILSDGGAPWRAAFWTPANNAAGSENYYSFDYGNAHVAVLDSNSSLAPGSPQHTFLDQDLSATTALWRFVDFHHTIYTSGRTESDLGLRADLVPLLDRHRVDAVFMGHAHVYERTKPLRGDAVVPPGEGTVYVTTGGGGGSLGIAGSSDITAYSEAAFHFVRATIDGVTLTLQMVRADGAVRDTTTIVKSGLDLVPVADTFIEAGAEAARNHGGAPTIEADAAPATVGYLKFDLRTVTAGVRRATLTLTCADNSEAGGTFYPVADSSWVEGTGHGTTTGPGLTWNDVDTNRDGRITAADAARWAPDLTQPLARVGAVRAGRVYAIDLTAAFQAGR